MQIVQMPHPSETKKSKMSAFPKTDFLRLWVGMLTRTLFQTVFGITFNNELNRVRVETNDFSAYVY